VIKQALSWLKGTFWDGVEHVTVSNRVIFKDGQRVLYDGPLHEAPEWLKAEYEKARSALDEMKKEIEKHRC